MGFIRPTHGEDRILTDFIPTVWTKTLSLFMRETQNKRIKSMKKETIVVFSQITDIISVILFGGILIALIISMLRSESLLAVKSLSPVLIIMMATTALVFSFRKATITMNDEHITYSGGFLKKKLELSQILSVNLITKKDLPPAIYKIWAYYAFGEINGLIKLDNGKKAYLAGNSETYLHLISNNVDMLLAVGEKGLSNSMIDAILKTKKI